MKGSGKKRKRTDAPVEVQDGGNQDNNQVDEETQRPLQSKIPKPFGEVQTENKLYVVLEKACLETVKRKNEFELLNCDDHLGILRANKRDLNDGRPDITHQCLLSLLDSPLNKAGKLQVYIHTQRNVLIEVHPQVRIPRTYKRFSGLMVQLLHKLTIRAADGPMQLLKVVKNPVTQYFPVGCTKIGTSRESEKLIDINTYVKTLRPGPIVFVIGAFARGSMEVDYIDEQIAISSYGLSGAAVCSKVCYAMEQLWGVL
jgi:rRNA small subunit pseudouridine methyltransferase Nep1